MFEKVSTIHKEKKSTVDITVAEYQVILRLESLFPMLWIINPLLLTSFFIHKKNSWINSYFDFGFSIFSTRRRLLSLSVSRYQCLVSFLCRKRWRMKRKNCLRNVDWCWCKSSLNTNIFIWLSTTKNIGRMWEYVLAVHSNVVLQMCLSVLAYKIAL